MLASQILSRVIKSVSDIANAAQAEDRISVYIAFNQLTKDLTDLRDDVAAAEKELSQ